MTIAGCPRAGARARLGKEGGKDMTIKEIAPALGFSPEVTFSVGEDLQVRVRDNGRGIGTPSRTSGLANMRQCARNAWRHFPGRQPAWRRRHL